MLSGDHLRATMVRVPLVLIRQTMTWITGMSVKNVVRKPFQYFVFVSYLGLYQCFCATVFKKKKKTFEKSSFTLKVHSCTLKYFFLPYFFKKGVWDRIILISSGLLEEYLMQFFYYLKSFFSFLKPSLPSSQQELLVY